MLRIFWKNTHSTVNWSHTGGPCYMRSFYMRFCVYAIQKWAFFWNLSSNYQASLVFLYAKYSLYAILFLESLSLAYNEVQLFSKNGPSQLVHNSLYNFYREHWTGEVSAVGIMKKKFVFIKTTYSSRYSFVPCNSRYALYSLTSISNIRGHSNNTWHSWGVIFS